jgi:outer membrane protein
MTQHQKTLLLIGVLALLTGPAIAQSQGDWTLGIGIANVNPSSNNGTLSDGTKVDIDDANGAIFTAEYFVANNVGIELLASTQFDHDFSLNGLDAGSFKLLPPTLSANYHFPTGSAWTPYLGVGVTYAYVSDEKFNVSGFDLDIDNNWGWAVQAGIDYQVTQNSALRFNVRYIDVSTDVKLDGTKIGSVDADPLVLSASYVFQF